MKEIMERKGIGEKAAAKRAGFTGEQLHAILSGKRRVGGLEVIRLSEALEVMPNELFGQSDQLDQFGQFKQRHMAEKDRHEK